MACQGHKAPKPGVITMIAVIAEHEVLALGNHEFAVTSEVLQLPPPDRIDRRIGVDLGREVLEEGIGGRRLESRVGLGENLRR